MPTNGQYKQIAIEQQKIKRDLAPRRFQIEECIAKVIFKSKHINTIQKKNNPHTGSVIHFCLANNIFFGVNMFTCYNLLNCVFFMRIILHCNESMFKLYFNR